MNSATAWTYSFETDLGRAQLNGVGELVSSFGWIDGSERTHSAEEVSSEPAKFIVPLIQSVLRGDQVAWQHLLAIPLNLSGTPFQTKVWAALREIPFGTTWSYGALAKRLGLGPQQARAVGTACGQNRVALFIPCHRVVSASGELAGFRWGLSRKLTLLALEGSRPLTLVP